METPPINPADYLVLVCDDEESIRSALGDALGEWGFQVATAPSGEAALEYIHGGHIPHIVLSDIRMLGMTGIELAAKVKEISEEIEVIIMTSHGSFETAVQAMRIGVHDYLSKPFDNIEDVRQLLVHVCGRIYMRFYTEYLMEELKRKTAEIEAHASVSTELSQTLEIPKTLQIGCRGLSQALANASVAFFQLHPAQQALVAMFRHPDEVFGKAQVSIPLPPGLLQTPAKVQPYLEGLEASPEFQRALGDADQLSGPLKGNGEPWVVFPVVTRGTPRGVFVIRSAHWNGDDSRALAKRYLQTITTALENALLHARVLETAIRDSLTGLFNVRYFKERFQAEIGKSERFRHPVSLMFFDVDHFKKYNDTHGHPAGDEVLRRMAALLKKNFRNTDIVARYGGEEFVVLMPYTAFADALAKAESFRKVVEEAPFPNEHTQPLGKVTVSIGVSEYPSHGGSMDAVIKASDDALYEGKKKSRNVVVPGKPAEGYVAAFEPVVVRSDRKKTAPAPK